MEILTREEIRARLKKKPLETKPEIVFKTQVYGLADFLSNFTEKLDEKDYGLAFEILTCNKSFSYLVSSDLLEFNYVEEIGALQTTEIQ